MNENKLISRRKVLHASLLVAPLLAAPRLALAGRACMPTAPQSEGPFYPTGVFNERSNLIRPSDSRGAVTGERIVVEGIVVEGIVVEGPVSGKECRPLSHAMVQIWQADHKGRYNHPGERGKAALDAYFHYWGQTITDGEGRYRFVTILPSPYKAGSNWTRPPHIHFRVLHGRGGVLTTQMYFPGHPLNEQDYLFNNVPEARRRGVVAVRVADLKRKDSPVPQFRFDIGLG